ncbi:hypothetical protein FXO38_27223 [Capsicum annuum]|uniref:Uncharacterized protein n=1 Tax=Capsicum annuum TaxID=4072 RepID=A0A2G2ZQY9_CAPAN|nr:hypothetical protein FXO38_27223 [Capsicum annuum]KAF3633778.1 hypothetical protein FXO37_26877 [Capsicum annuum]PHT84375.1 hypothetical protein T459_12818 [Capsicum annuum]
MKFLPAKFNAAINFGIIYSTKKKRSNDTPKSHNISNSNTRVEKEVPLHQYLASRLPLLLHHAAEHAIFLQWWSAELLVTSITSCFKGLRSLEVLDISYNEIGAHSIDTRRYLCSSPPNHKSEANWKPEESEMHGAEVADYWN